VISISDSWRAVVRAHRALLAADLRLLHVGGMVGLHRIVERWFGGRMERPDAWVVEQVATRASQLHLFHSIQRRLLGDVYPADPDCERISNLEGEASRAAAAYLAFRRTEPDLARMLDRAVSVGISNSSVLDD
jgi:hypothetical protein